MGDQANRRILDSGWSPAVRSFLASLVLVLCPVMAEAQTAHQGGINQAPTPPSTPDEGLPTPPKAPPDSGDRLSLWRMTENSLRPGLTVRLSLTDGQIFGTIDTYPPELAEIAGTLDGLTDGQRFLVGTLEGETIIGSTRIGLMAASQVAANAFGTIDCRDAIAVIESDPSRWMPFQLRRVGNRLIGQHAVAGVDGKCELFTPPDVPPRVVGGAAVFELERRATACSDISTTKGGEDSGGKNEETATVFLFEDVADVRETLLQMRDHVLTSRGEAVPRVPGIPDERAQFLVELVTRQIRHPDDFTVVYDPMPEVVMLVEDLLRRDSSGGAGGIGERLRSWKDAYESRLEIDHMVTIELHSDLNLSESDSDAVELGIRRQRAEILGIFLQGIEGLLEIEERLESLERRGSDDRRTEGDNGEAEAEEPSILEFFNPHIVPC